MNSAVVVVRSHVVFKLINHQSNANNISEYVNVCKLCVYEEERAGEIEYVLSSDGEMKLHEALSFSTKWFTKGFISGGFICSQYHLVAKECKTSRYITDRGG